MTKSKIPSTPFVLGKKDWLLAGKPDGTAASTASSSQIKAAKDINLEPYSYLQ